MDRRIRLVLASGSPRRRQLLKKLKIPFRVIPSHIAEKLRYRDPVRLVKDLALRKALSVARRLGPLPRLSSRHLKMGPWVLGADTVVVLDNWIVSKPTGHKDAYQMLSRLAGSTHYVYTGVALVDAERKKAVVSYARSSVRMKSLGQKELRRLSRAHLDKAG